MKQESTFKMVVRTVVVLLLVTGIVAIALAGVNAITKDRIAELKAEKTRQALEAVLPDAASAKALETFSDETGLVQTVYESETGYAMEVTPTGFGGTVTLMVGVDHEGKVLGISVVSHTETAGLGAVAAEKTAKGQTFRDQFAGMSGELAVKKDGGKVDALSGATITSRAVTEGVNAAIACGEKLG